jgi:hypothetical protein
MSKITVNDKESYRIELNRLRRNWVEELVGGGEESELII